MARGDYEAEPDRLLQYVCPHCATWFTDKEIDKDHRKFDICSGRLVEVRYCNCTNHERVELHSAAEIGELTPWEEWKRDQLLDEMEHLERKIKNIQRELNDYFMWENGRGC